MAAKLFFLPYACATVNGIAQPGAQLFFYQTGTLTKLPVYTTSLLSVQQTNPVIASGAGRFPDVYLDSTQTYRLTVRDANGALLDDIDPYIPGTVEGLVVGNDSPTANTRTQLASMISGAGANAMAFLSEPGREGMFVWSSANLSAKVTADTQQGIYIAPASDMTGASGAWVRKFDADWSIEWFGATPNDSSTGAKTANDAAIEATKTLDQVLQNANNGTVPSLYFPAAAYYFGSGGHDLKITRRWRGNASGAAIAGGYMRTQLIVPAGCKFLRVEAYNTIGETVEGTPTTGADGSMFVDLAFVGNGGVVPDSGTPNTSGYALHPRCPISVYNCQFNWHCDGIYNNAAAGGGGAIEGQSSHCHYSQCSFSLNYSAGINDTNAPDNNISTVDHCNFIANGRAGIIGGEFLGSNLTGSNHFRDNGCRVDFFPVCSQCSYGGNRYYVNETATISTTDAALRVGNPTTNSLWTLIGAGAPDIGDPDFTTFTGTFQKGGPVIADRTTNARWTAIGYYGESGQPPFFWNSSCFIAPGASACGDIGYGTAVLGGTIHQTANGVDNTLTQTRIKTSVASRTAALWNNAANGGYGIPTSLVFEQGLDDDGVTPRQIACIRSQPNSATNTVNYGIVEIGTRPIASGAMTWWWQFSDAPLRSGPIADNAVDIGSAGVRVKVVYGYTGNFTTAVTSAGTITSTGATSGVGYATGAGGAVTQATSKATGVTLNKVCGAITLNNAALAATTLVTFTLTNSAIAADDDVRVWVKSGLATPGSYRVAAEGSSAGSRTIVVENKTAGSLSEAVVLGFSVVKVVVA